MISELIFLLSLLLLAYAWAGYPVILKFLTWDEMPASMAQPPAVSVAILFSAYNEERHIGARLENLLALLRQGYAGRAEVYVGVDGADDGTAAIATEFAKGHAQVHIHDFRQRRGKIAVLKDLVRTVMTAEHAHGSDLAPVLVFTDANTVFRPDALPKLLAPFADPSVGGVCGRLFFVDGKAAGTTEPEESLYWKWETRLKTAESRLDSCLGANGAIFAIRGELFWNDIPDNTIVDDFVIGMKVREAGFRMVYQADAVAEETVPRTRDEWNRRVRIGAGDYQALWLCRRCLRPSCGRFAWMFWSHKVFRWFTPHLILLCLLSASCLVIGAKESVLWPVARLVCLGAAAMLLCAAAGRIGRSPKNSGSCRSGWNPTLQTAQEKALCAHGGTASTPSTMILKLFRQCDHFLTMQAALFVGFFRFCRGGLKGHWTRTPR